MSKHDLSRPPIAVRQADHARLMHLAIGGLLRAPRDAGALLEEIGRARVLADSEINAATVVLGSQVTFCTDDRELPQQVTLVLHAESGDTRQVSALTNLGAGLLGLSKGQTISWPDRTGGRRELTVLDVRAPRPDDKGAAEGASTPTPPRQASASGDVVAFPPRERAIRPPDDPPPSAA